ncbi:MAG: IS21 family transposase [Thermodesulfobacteriota bacterium]
MKGWVMIHKIKAMYDNGRGSSIRCIAGTLEISRNTVRKYIRLDEKVIAEEQEDRQREKKLDDYRDFLINLLKRYPRLSAVKALGKLREKAPGIGVSDRTVRRYIGELKQKVSAAQARYYEPVVDSVPGVQCQVDLGEQRQILIGGVENVVYFSVFVLSYSRLMYVAVSPRPIDTEIFIRMHDAAFRYFGGVCEECVYDQTKLVVIEETFRELKLNERFHAYAIRAGFYVRACEGYDPESKGKVEAGVKYVKQSGLYGEEFSSWEDLEGYILKWLNDKANMRVHGTTGQVPRALYEREERSAMRPYLTPPELFKRVFTRRKVDKTGLICWQGNKYSVPLAYQQGQVGVELADGKLLICDLETGKGIASHRLYCGKGQVIKNNNHYRDHSKRIADYEEAILNRVGERLGNDLCQLLKQTSPSIYKDQLAGLLRILKQHGDIPVEMLKSLVERPRLTATQVQDYFYAYCSSPERWNKSADLTPVSSQAASLARYGAVIKQPGGFAS